ncbi:formyltetrahydrofolate deformylase [Rothia sp. ZJ932]|uniref:formyltetrahydrofolate deformylase n=1 Tax=Rothia sp. ZJ932 TaxID=2810516 RepID=UPI001F073418|nr:formyltetrahydrofolate deformylase [Rothia sp. ZJ932]
MASALLANQDEELILTLDCPETIGIVYALTGVFLKHKYTIIDLQQFDDLRTGHFFIRVQAAPFDGASAAYDAIKAEIDAIAPDFSMRYELRYKSEKRRVLIMSSKADHCLNDLFYRTRTGDLPIEIVGVVSNHRDHQRLSEWNGVPFYHIPVTPDTKADAEAQLLDVVDRLDVDLVVLARYMQILSNDLADKMEGRVINIHHSFLPSFKGAKPYHQAFERGVKTIGATAHYVNSELDEGPIIAQEVINIDHTYSPEDLVRRGRDAETKALADAVRWHCEGRVILKGGRTVVLR